MPTNVYISKLTVNGNSYDIKDSTARDDLEDKADIESPAFTGTPTAPTAAAGTNTTQIATTAFVMNAFQANDAMIFKGTIGSSGATVSALPATHYQGWTYKVITAGSYAGKTCEIGDMIICVTDGTSANNDHWTVVQSNIDGAVTGPASSTSGHIATFSGDTGKLISDSGFTIATSVPENAVFTDTDTTVTSSSNHYTPTTASGSEISANASGASAEWSIDVVKGVSLSTDGKGHVTGINVTSGKIPANPDTDTHRVIKVNGTQALASNDTALNLKNGSNVTITDKGSGEIEIAATDTTYSTATTSANGLMSKADKNYVDGLKNKSSAVRARYFNNILTGTGTAGQKGSASAAYIPALWTFDLDFAPFAGDVLTIKVPVVGVNSGVWLSVDNGTTYYPVAVSGTSGLTTQYPENVSLQLIYEIGMTTKIYGTDQTGAPAGASTSNYTGGRWSVLNYYDTNTTYSAMTVALLEAGTNTTNRSIRADVFKGAIQSVVAQSNGKVQVYGTDVGVGIDQGSANAGKILTVGSNGIVSPQAAPSGLPAVTSSDNGKVLMVANGAWAAQTIPNASGVSF